jgi:hypothetical protein
MLFGRATGCAMGVRQAMIAAAALLTAAFTALSMSPLAAQTPEQAQTLAQQAIRRLDLQTELLRQPEPFQFDLNLPPETLWLIVLLGVGMMLYVFRDMIPMFRIGRDAAGTIDEPGAAATGQPASGMALGAADDLAAQGRYVEAMHVLLLQALAEIRARLNEPFADSLTSREILRSKQLSDNLRQPLRDVVGRVEWTYFGEHPAEHNDYLACRSSFAALARSLYGSAAA